MAYIHLQQKAQRDLIGIWQYSCDNWGEEVLAASMDYEAHLQK